MPKSPAEVWLLASIAGLVVLAVWMARAPHFGADALAFWSIDPVNPYASASGVTGLGAFRYGPPIALALLPLHALPFWATAFGALIVSAAALVYLTGRWAFAALLLPPVLIELEFGNIDLVIAACVVAGFRFPALWSVVLLTKITPGIGLLWFVVRREWRNAAIATLATAALAFVSFVVRPDLWPEWFGALSRAIGQSPVDALWIPVPLVVRLPLAAVIVCAGAASNRRWTVLVAATIATPTLWFAALGMLVGLLRRDEALDGHREARPGVRALAPQHAQA